MENFISGFGFTLAILLANWIFRLISGSWVNAFSVLSLPIATIVLFTNSIGSGLGYMSISGPAIGLLAIATGAYWLGAIVPSIAVIATSRRAALSRICRQLPSSERWIEKQLWFVVIIALTVSGYLYSKGLSIYGWSSFGTENLAGIVGRGPLAHLRLLAYPALIFMFLRYSQQGGIVRLLATVALWLSQFGTGVKYHAILPILTLAYLLWMRNPRWAIKYLPIGIVIIFLAFIGSYIAFFLSQSVVINFTQLKWIALHLMDYILGGPIALGTFIDGMTHRLDLPWIQSFLLASLPSPVMRLFGVTEPIAVTQWYVPIRVDGVTNVGTIVWELYRLLDIGGMVIWLTFAGLIASLLLIFALRYASLPLQALAAHVMSLITLSFFANYLKLWTPWEYGFWMLVVATLISPVGTTRRSSSQGVAELPNSQRARPQEG